MKKIEGEDYRDETRIVHILQALERLDDVAEQVKSVDSLLLDDPLTRAIMFDFIVLGEAANNVSIEYCALHPEIPWKDVSAFRHKLVHDYAGIEYRVVYDALKTDVPSLLPLVQKLVSELPADPASPENLSEFD